MAFHDRNQDENHRGNDRGDTNRAPVETPQEELNRLRREIEEMRTKQQELQQEINEQQDELGAWEYENRELEEKVKDANAQIEELECCHYAIEREFAVAHEFQQEVEEAQALEYEANENLNRERNASRLLRDQLAARENEVTTLRRQRDTALNAATAYMAAVPRSAHAENFREAYDTLHDIVDSVQREVSGSPLPGATSSSGAGEGEDHGGTRGRRGGSQDER